MGGRIMKYARIVGILAVIICILSSLFLCYEGNGNWGWFLYIAAFIAAVVYSD
jgi:hypothetical protein